MQIDTLRAVFTYTIAMVVVVGGFAIIVYTRGDLSASDIRILIAGFIGLALQFVFGQEVQTRTARQAAASTAAAAANGGHTMTADEIAKKIG